MLFVAYPSTDELEHLTPQTRRKGDLSCSSVCFTNASVPFQGTEIDWNALYKETLEQCELADQMGFDNLWFVEHHFLTGFSGSPAQDAIFGALSRITKQIRIGYGVCILPYHHPVRVAERVALLDS